MSGLSEQVSFLIGSGAAHELGRSIAEGMAADGAAERRRYALLQAAATIAAHQCASITGVINDADRLAEAAEVLLAALMARESRAKEGR